MFTDTDIQVLLSNLETSIQTEETTFADVCRIRETLHLQNEDESWYCQ